MFNSYKTKINEKCSFHKNTKLINQIPQELRANIMKCLKNLHPLRVFQMEKMAVRSTLDSTLIMNDTTTEVSVDFMRDSIQKYSYDSSMDKIQGYVYSLVEAICYQCGFFSWEELRK